MPTETTDSKSVMANAYVKACVDAHRAQVADKQGLAVTLAKLADAIEDAYPDAAEAARAANGAEVRSDDRSQQSLP